MQTPFIQQVFVECLQVSDFVLGGVYGTGSLGFQIQVEILMINSIL